MDYTVVIVTYNRLELLKECLECVEKQILKFDNIIIVNNHSVDGTTEYLDNYCNNRKNITLINTEKNIGGSGGFEIGIKSIPDETDYVLLIDDDAMLDVAFLSEIDAHRNDDIMAYSGTILTDGIIDTSHRRRLKNTILMTKEDVRKEEYSKDYFLFDLATFCGLMISKEIIDKIGNPKGEYFIWYDDTEYCFRIMKYTKIKNVNTAHINHKTKIFNETDLNWKSYYGYRNQIDVGKRYSRMPFIYKMFRYTYHRYRVLYFLRLAKKNRNDDYYLECVKLHKAVLRDSKRDVLGFNEEFYPGKKLRSDRNSKNTAADLP